VRDAAGITSATTAPLRTRLPLHTTVRCRAPGTLPLRCCGRLRHTRTALRLPLEHFCPLPVGVWVSALLPACYGPTLLVPSPPSACHPASTFSMPSLLPSFCPTVGWRWSLLLLPPALPISCLGCAFVPPSLQGICLNRLFLLFTWCHSPWEFPLQLQYLTLCISATIPISHCSWEVLSLQITTLYTSLTFLISTTTNTHLELYHWECRLPGAWEACPAYHCTVPGVGPSTRTPFCYYLLTHAGCHTHIDRPRLPPTTFAPAFSCLLYMPGEGREEEEEGGSCLSATSAPTLSFLPTRLGASFYTAHCPAACSIAAVHAYSLPCACSCWRSSRPPLGFAPAACFTCLLAR